MHITGHSRAAQRTSAQHITPHSRVHNSTVQPIALLSITIITQLSSTPHHNPARHGYCTAHPSCVVHALKLTGRVAQCTTHTNAHHSTLYVLACTMAQHNPSCAVVHSPKTERENSTSQHTTAHQRTSQNTLSMASQPTKAQHTTTYYTMVIEQLAHNSFMVQPSSLRERACHSTKPHNTPMHSTAHPSNTPATPQPA